MADYPRSIFRRDGHYSGVSPVEFHMGSGDETEGEARCRNGNEPGRLVGWPRHDSDGWARFL